MNLRSATYVITREVRAGILDKEGYKNEDDVTTDASLDSEPEFDSLDDNKFDPILSSDYNVTDDFMDID